MIFPEPNELDKLMFIATILEPKVSNKIDKIAFVRPFVIKDKK